MILFIVSPHLKFPLKLIAHRESSKPIEPSESSESSKPIEPSESGESSMLI